METKATAAKTARTLTTTERNVMTNSMLSSVDDGGNKDNGINIKNSLLQPLQQSLLKERYESMPLDIYYSLPQHLYEALEQSIVLKSSNSSSNNNHNNNNHNQKKKNDIIFHKLLESSIRKGPITLRPNLQHCTSSQKLIERLSSDAATDYIITKIAPSVRGQRGSDGCFVTLPFPGNVSPVNIIMQQQQQSQQQQQPQSSSIWSTKTWRDGWFEVQDAGSQTIIGALFENNNDTNNSKTTTKTKTTNIKTFLDYCSGNGGKTFAAASVMMAMHAIDNTTAAANDDNNDNGRIKSNNNNGCLIVSHDIDERRLAQIRGSLNRVISLDDDNHDIHDIYHQNNNDNYQENKDNIRIETINGSSSMMTWNEKCRILQNLFRRRRSYCSNSNSIDENNLNNIETSKNENENDNKKNLNVDDFYSSDDDDIYDDGMADAVLVDAPCSSSGTLRRRPDLRWECLHSSFDNNVVLENCFSGGNDDNDNNNTNNECENDSGERGRPSLQLSILKEASTFVRRRIVGDNDIGENVIGSDNGGRLVYATCSLLQSENEDVVEAFESIDGFDDKWERWGFSNHDKDINGDGDGVVAAKGVNWCTVYPEEDGPDGFFIARWKRK